MKYYISLPLVFVILALLIIFLIIKSLANHNKELSRENNTYRFDYKQLNSNYKTEVRDLNSIIKNLESTIEDKEAEIESYQSELNTRNDYYKKMLEGNRQAIPYLAGLMADYLTYDYEVLARQLDWGYDAKRLKKVADIREIRNDAKQRIQIAKEAEYNYKYLLELYPELQDVVDADYSELNEIQRIKTDMKNDSVSEYLSRDEWNSLSESQRNQLALDRYIEGRKKSKWQIGRDYELYVGYSRYETQGWHVDYYGNEMRLEDLGRDLIASNSQQIEIVQCKYWSSKKLIHEKHIFQLLGTTFCYKLEHPDENRGIRPVLITNIEVSDVAKEAAKLLRVKIIENYAMGDFPRIKCNIGHNEYGLETKIYHLPMDQQYDTVKIDNHKGEFFAFTVEEAEKKGFRRAHKWYGNRFN